ncbi:MAG: D-alanyl-D-alanine carboxypeptidase [Nitrospirae bacterium]|nr:D-alanyl-D-alanine carboxypeptidase [Nitrospirota bacterium]MDE3050491.1 D-alanyl-D-alanine carboxypeptidase [Nitrospirota bacterium]MDE3220122.1 D-alanyl-D-alanine carboxypeptidase [Nitrospirota bacterium]
MSAVGRGGLLVVGMAVTVMLSCVDVGAEDLPVRPSIKASALYLVELKSGRVLLEKDATRRLPPASLTKLMTALVALEAATPEQVVRVDRRALVHRSSLKLRSGEQFLLRDLLTAMLVTSANDACEAIAWYVGGNAGRFVTLMNERARTLGLKNTHFANACGFDAPGHYSTAEDLAKLTEQALQVPAISMMVRTITRDITSVDGARQVLLRSTNEMLLDPDVNGVKTGYTSKAGRCLIASMFKDGHRLLLVGLNVRDRWEQATSLLRYGQAVLRVGNE